MAQRVITETVSDFSGETLTSEDSFTIEVHYEGKLYRLDGTQDEVEQIAQYLKPDQVVPSSGTGRSAKRADSGSGLSKEELAQARKWLRDQGHELSDRGRIKADLLKLYTDAH